MSKELDWAEYEYFRLPLGAQEVYGQRNGLTLVAEAVNIEAILTAKEDTLRKALEGIRKPETSIDRSNVAVNERIGYNQALDDIRTLLTPKN